MKDQKTPSIDVEVDERTYRIRALPSLRQRNVLLRLVKQFSGVLPLAKNEITQALSMNIRGKDSSVIKTITAVTYSLATTIDTLIDNMNQEEMNFIIGECLEHTQIKRPENGVFVSVRELDEDPFSCRFVHLMKLVKAHMEFNFEDFLAGWADGGIQSIPKKLEALEQKIMKMGLVKSKKSGSSQQSTGSTTE